jgi:hypothetical protein
MGEPESIPEELRDAFLDTMRHAVMVQRVAVVLLSRFCAGEESAHKAAEMIVDMVREEYER